MNERDEQAVREAMKQRRNAQPTRSEETGEKVAQFGSGQLAGVTDKLADNIVDLVWSEALRKAFSRLGNGDMGELAPRMMAQFEEGLTNNFELEVQLLEEWNDSPKYALLPTQESDG